MKRDLLALLVIVACLCAAYLCAGCASDPQGQPGETNRGISGVGVGGTSSAAGSGEAAGGCPTGCTTPPPGCVIKGNINLRTGERVYHLPGQKHYNDVTIEPETGERWFCTEDEAEANGWRRSRK